MSADPEAAGAGEPVTSPIALSGVRSSTSATSDSPPSPGTNAATGEMEVDVPQSLSRLPLGDSHRTDDSEAAAVGRIDRRPRELSLGPLAAAEMTAHAASVSVAAASAVQLTPLVPPARSTADNSCSEDDVGAAIPAACIHLGEDGPTRGSVDQFVFGSPPEADVGLSPRGQARAVGSEGLGFKSPMHPGKSASEGPGAGLTTLASDTLGSQDSTRHAFHARAQRPSPKLVLNALGTYQRRHSVKE